MKRTTLSLLLFCFGMLFSHNAFATTYQEGLIRLTYYGGHVFHVRGGGAIKDSLGSFQLIDSPNATDAYGNVCTNSTVAKKTVYPYQIFCTEDYELTQRFFDFSSGITLPFVINGRLFTDVISDASSGSDLFKSVYGYKRLQLYFYNRADNPNITTSATLIHGNYSYPQDQHYVSVKGQGMTCTLNPISTTNNSLANCETYAYGQTSVSIENVGIVNAKSSQDMYFNGSLYFPANTASGFSSLHQLTVTVDPLVGGTITNFPDCLIRPNNMGNVWQGNCAGDVTLKSLANTGWGLLQWNDGMANYFNDNLTVGMDVNKSITATFSQMVSLSIHIDPLQGGSVTGGDGEISCSTDPNSVCDYNVLQGEQVTIEASPTNPNDSFLHWKIGTEQFTDNPLTLTMDVAKVVEPVFEKKVRYPISYTPENPDGWSCSVQSFGSLNHNGTPHMGEDWNKSGDRGQQLYAIADGTVTDITTTSNDPDPWGKTILIRHVAPAGYYFLTGTGQKLSTVYSLYAHMLQSGQVGYVAAQNIQHSEAESIMSGEFVGQLGDSNGKWSDHLHFGILTDESHVSGYRDNGYGWSLLSLYTDPSELISNGFYSDASTKFSIIVHPYECTGTFMLDDNTPNCNGASATIGNWTRRGGNYSDYFQLGYNGIIYSKAADSVGNASWRPNLPKDGQYKILVYIPRNDTNYDHYATSTNAVYTVSHNGWSYNSQPVDQSAITDANRWVNIGIYDLLQYGNPTVELQGNTGEIGKSIAVDAVKFEYLGPI
ncbi:MAG: membrane metalloendopeptidase [uncultured bacterium]|nr:MAG: membrane metalloendopeptidase [uncultured bacterium]